MKPLVLPFNGISPRILPSVFLAPGSVVVGDVEVGENANLWFHTVVALAYHEIPPEAVFAELERRFGQPPRPPAPPTRATRRRARAAPRRTKTKARPRTRNGGGRDA